MLVSRTLVSVTLKCAVTCLLAEFSPVPSGHAALPLEPPADPWHSVLLPTATIWNVRTEAACRSGAFFWLQREFADSPYIGIPLLSLQYLPTVGAVIEIQSRKVQIYSAQLWIHAHFTGIRYLLFNFPLTSAVLGVASNFAFLSVLVLFSYLQFIWGGIWPPEQVRVRVLLRNGAQAQQRREEPRRRISYNEKTERNDMTQDPGIGTNTEPPGKGELESDVPETVGSLNGLVSLQDEAPDEPILLEAPDILDTTMSEEEPDAGEVVEAQGSSEQQEDSATVLRQRQACMSF